MIDYQGMVLDFHRQSNSPIRRTPGFPRDPNTLSRRQGLLLEEFIEYGNAIEDGDLIGMADAIGDIMYLLFGDSIILGLPMDKIFAEIHRSNMTKLIDGIQKRDDGKIIKGNSYEPPDLISVIADSYIEEEGTTDVSKCCQAKRTGYGYCYECGKPSSKFELNSNRE
jgi:predicted HAD superfamily Cof-like phosphohydrolase